MNKVILMGRLTADPEVRYTQDGKAVASFSLAVDRRSAKQDQKADFIRCQVWEKKAEVAQKYFVKGTKILISGRIQTGTYKDRNGKTVYTTDVVIEEMEFAESKAQSTDPKPEPKPEQKPDNDGFIHLDPNSIDEDLPFN